VRFAFLEKSTVEIVAAIINDNRRGQVENSGTELNVMSALMAVQFIGSATPEMSASSVVWLKAICVVVLVESTWKVKVARTPLPFALLDTSSKHGISGISP